MTSSFGLGMQHDQAHSEKDMHYNRSGRQPSSVPANRGLLEMCRKRPTLLPMPYSEIQPALPTEYMYRVRVCHPAPHDIISG